MLLIRDCQPVIFERGIFSFTQVWQSCVSWAVSGIAVPAGSSRRTAAGKPHSRCCCPAEARGSWSSSWCRAWTDGTSPSGPPTPPAGSWRQPQESQVRTTSGGAASSAEPWNETFTKYDTKYWEQFCLSIIKSTMNYERKSNMMFATVDMSEQPNSSATTSCFIRVSRSNWRLWCGSSDQN